MGLIKVGGKLDVKKGGVIKIGRGAKIIVGKKEIKGPKTIKEKQKKTFK